MIYVWDGWQICIIEMDENFFLRWKEIQFLLLIQGPIVNLQSILLKDWALGLEMKTSIFLKCEQMKTAGLSWETIFALVRIIQKISLVPNFFKKKKGKEVTILFWFPILGLVHPRTGQKVYDLVIGPLIHFKSDYSYF